MPVTVRMTFLLLIWHSQYGKNTQIELVLVCGWVWSVTLYQRWLLHSSEFRVDGYFRAQYYLSILAKLHEQIAELPAAEGCRVCYL